MEPLEPLELELLRQSPILCLRFGDWSSSAKPWFLCVRALGEVANRSTRQFDDSARGWHFGSSIPFASPSPPAAASCHTHRSTCLMQLHCSAVAFAFLSLYLCFAFPSHFLREVTCFIAVSLCPWWLVTHINRQMSSVYTLPKESSRSSL